MIQVDFREPKEILQYFNEFEVCKLNGDYLVNNIAFERKTFTDFLQTLYAGRLFNQLAKTKKEHKNTILIIENLIDPNFLTNPKIFYSTTQYITLNLGVPVVFSQSLQNTAEIITRAGTLKELNFFYFNTKFVPLKINTTERMLQCIPGIGRKRAKYLLNKYESIIKIANLNKKDICRIDRNLVRKIKHCLEDGKT